MADPGTKIPRAAKTAGSGPRRRFTRARQLFGRGVARNKLLLLLAVVGPGIITSNVDNDPGGITTYSIAGAHFGYDLLWMLFPMLIALIVVQEMCVRMGIVTGKGLADLIRENFGLKLTFYLLAALLVTNMFNTMSEFSGVAAAAELLGVSRYIALPLAAMFVLYLIFRGTYRVVERVFLVASTFYVAYIVAAFMAKPDWGEVVHSAVVPHIELSTAYIVLMVGLIGTTIAPWMQFYIQASSVEKNIKREELRYAQIDVTIGSIMAVTVAGFIIIATAATLHNAGVRVDSAAEAAKALEPFAGKYAKTLFALGLLAAGVFSAGILPLSTAYHVCEGMGWPAGVSHAYRDARQFYVLYLLIVAVAVVPVLLPQIPLVKVMFFSQVANGVLLPFVLLMMLRLVNDPDLMGDKVNGVLFNVIAYATVVLVILFTLAGVVLPLMQGLFA